VLLGGPTIRMGMGVSMWQALMRRQQERALDHDESDKKRSGGIRLPTLRVALKPVYLARARVLFVMSQAETRQE